MSIILNDQAGKSLTIFIKEKIANGNDSLEIILASTLIFLSVCRGLVPLLLNSSAAARPTYYSITFFGIILSIYGIYKILSSDVNKYKALSLLLIFNLILHILWLFPVAILRPEPNQVLSVIYTGIFPFSIYLFIKLSKTHLVRLMLLLSLVVSFFVLFDFMSYNTNYFTDGYANAIERQQLLRSDFRGPGRTGAILRPSGITGSSSPHDSANLLTLFFVFWFAYLFQTMNYRTISAILAVTTFSALLCSQSASNIIAAILGVTITALYYSRKIFTKTGLEVIAGLILVSILVLSIVSIYLFDLAFLNTWLLRLESSYGWRHMLSFLYTDYNISDLYSLLFGHGRSLELSQAALKSEVSLITLVFKYGVFHSLVFYALLLYPLYLFINRNKQIRRSAFPFLVTTVTGIVTLWHYGSLFRATNIFVFFAFYAQTINLLGYREYKVVPVK